MILLFATLFSAFAGADFFPNFYGDYRVNGWQCESTMNDRGCRESARVVIEPSGSVSTISVFNAAGARIRWNEMIEKGDAKNSAVLSGGDDFAVYTVEARASNGSRYFYNVFEIRRLENGVLQFTHISDQNLGGMNNSMKRVFELTNP